MADKGIVDDAVDVLADVTKYIEMAKELLDQYPELRALVLTAFQKLQELIREAGIAKDPGKPVGADAISAMARGSIDKLQESQSTLEQFIEWSLDSSESLVEMLAELLGAED